MLLELVGGQAHVFEEILPDVALRPSRFRDRAGDQRGEEDQRAKRPHDHAGREGQVPAQVRSQDRVRDVGHDPLGRVAGGVADRVAAAEA